MYVSPEMVDHFICFITSQHIVQDLPFGQKHLSLSSGQVLEVPNVIRTLIPEHIVQQYQKYCKESGITCMSRRSLLRILDVCSASVRKSLQGLDYITASGSKAFDELENVTDKLGELGMGMSWAKQQKQQLKLAKRYLKIDYKVRTTKNLNKILINRIYKRTGGSVVEHRAVTREVVSSTPTGPTLRVLRKCCLCNYISKWLDFQVFSDKNYKPEVPSHNL